MSYYSILLIFTWNYEHFTPLNLAQCTVLHGTTLHCWNGKYSSPSLLLSRTSLRAFLSGQPHVKITYFLSDSLWPALRPRWPWRPARMIPWEAERLSSWLHRQPCSPGSRTGQQSEFLNQQNRDICLFRLRLG